LSVGSQLKPGQDISIQDARNLLGEVITGIASSIDKADISLLSDLAESGSDRGSSYAAISYYGSQAKAAGESYSSNGCPEYSRTITEQASASEENMMASAFSLWGEKLNHFGEPKIGVCRISNCPSRGNSNWYRSKTLVGGCDICVNCHKIFASGKSPKVIYKQQKDEKELKDKKALEKNKKLAKKSNKNKNKISKK
jgi:hypothetical protein